MNTFEDALKKLDQIEQNLNNQATEITQKDQEITEKDNRNAQLHKLFQGTAEIFNKQHNHVDKLKKQLEQEREEKGIGDEKYQHLQKDIKQLDQQKTELEQRIKDLKDAQKKSETERDKELADLRQKVATLTAQLAEVQNIDGQVYNILGKYSSANGLLPRANDVINKHQKELTWWDKWINSSENNFNSLQAKILSSKIHPVFVTSLEIVFNYKSGVHLISNNSWAKSDAEKSRAFKMSKSTFKDVVYMYYLNK